MYTLKDAYRKRQFEKARRNQDGMRSDKTAAEVSEAAGKSLGDEAASFLQRRGGAVGGVYDSRERIHVNPEAE
jgi:hypothetical protein